MLPKQTTLTVRRVCALLLVFLLAAASVPVEALAETSTAITGGELREPVMEQDTDTSLEYSAYLSAQGDCPVYAGEPVQLSAAQAENVVVQTVAGEEAVAVSANDSITWTLPSVEEGLYILRLRYASLVDGGNTHSVAVSLNDQPVNRQASLLTLPKQWVQPAVENNVYGRPFEVDQYGNELVAAQEEKQAWQTVTFTDSDGKYPEALLFRLSSGDRLTLTVKRSGVAVSGLWLAPVEQVSTYAEVEAGYAALGAQSLSGEPVVLQAELPAYTSDSSLLATTDHMSSATQPQAAMHILQNTIGQDYWKYNGQTITWEFTVPQTGLYKLNLRYRQDDQRGVRVARRIRLDGEIPFRDLERYTFGFSDRWEVEELGGDNPYLFYLTAGQTHTLSMEVVLAYPEQIRQMEEMLAELNGFYRQVLMIVGTEPDTNRDYLLDRTVPDFEKTLQQMEGDLRSLIDALYAAGFEEGGNIVVMEEVADMLADFLKRPAEIPVRLSTFSDSLAAMGSWMSELANQPLELDYLALVPAKEAALSANDGFFREFAYGFEVFVASYFGDYSSISSAEGEEALSVWVNSGRDQAQVIKRLISSSFTKEYGVSVNLNLVLQGLVPATLSGKGPDIIIGVSATDAVNLAVRDALVNLRDFEGGDNTASFAQVKDWFQPTSLDLYTYEELTYALPVEEQFNMLFVRTDILGELGLTIPQTWDELNNTVSILSRNYLEVGVPTNPGAGIAAQTAQGNVNEGIFQTLLFQEGGSYYEDGWSKTGFDSKAAINAFTRWTEYFTKYTLPTDYDLFSRFRSGQMPLAFGSYIFYNILNAGASELRGLWEMVPVPGTVRPDGTLDRSVAGGSTAIAMFAKTKNKEAGWQFLQWYVSTDTQVDYAKQIESILGPSGRFNPANVAALHEIGWDEEVEAQILEQWSQMKMVPMTPVSYYLSRSISNAFRKVTYSYTEPRDTLNRYNREINQEIQRKRNNMGLN